MSSPEPLAQSPEAALPSLPALIATAGEMWVQAQSLDAEPYPGHASTYDEQVGRADFSPEGSFEERGFTTTTSISRGADGIWVVKEARTIPIAGGGTYSTVRLFPLAAGAISNSWSEVHTRSGEAEPQEAGRSIPMTEPICEKLLRSLSFIRTGLDTVENQRRGAIATVIGWIGARLIGHGQAA